MSVCFSVCSKAAPGSPVGVSHFKLFDRSIGNHAGILGGLLSIVSPAFSFNSVDAEPSVIVEVLFPTSVCIQSKQLAVAVASRSSVKVDCKIGA
jgi:hypothetical protein